MSELLGVKVLLGVAGMGGEPEPWVCSGHRCKLEGTFASSWEGICVSLVPCEGPSYAGCWKRCHGLNYDLDSVRVPILLDVSDPLRVELPL